MEKERKDAAWEAEEKGQAMAREMLALRDQVNMSPPSARQLNLIL
jgi:hypothetical protein